MASQPCISRETNLALHNLAKAPTAFPLLLCAYVAALSSCSKPLCLTLATEPIDLCSRRGFLHFRVLTSQCALKMLRCQQLPVSLACSLASSKGLSVKRAPCIRPFRKVSVTRALSVKPARKDAMQERQRNRTEKLRVLRLISACVESNVRFPPYGFLVLQPSQSRQ